MRDRRSPFTSAGASAHVASEAAALTRGIPAGRSLECFASEDGMRRGSCEGAHVLRPPTAGEGRCGGLLLGALRR